MVAMSSVMRGCDPIPLPERVPGRGATPARLGLRRVERWVAPNALHVQEDEKRRSLARRTKRQPSKLGTSAQRKARS